MKNSLRFCRKNMGYHRGKIIKKLHTNSTLTNGGKSADYRDYGPIEESLNILYDTLSVATLKSSISSLVTEKEVARIAKGVAREGSYYVGEKLHAYLEKK
jgi:hypothetical protein